MDVKLGESSQYTPVNKITFGGDMFARTWSEELIAEWLCSKGFVVEIGVPAGTGKGGGRKEADVIGFKVEGNKTIIVHFEVTSRWEKAKKVIRALNSKFSPDRVDNIVKHVLSITKTQDYEYHKNVLLFTSRGILKAVKEDLNDKNINVYSLDEFYYKEILPLLKEKHRRTRTFPDSHWLLNMLLNFYNHNLLPRKPPTS